MDNRRKTYFTSRRKSKQKKLEDELEAKRKLIEEGGDEEDHMNKHVFPSSPIPTPLSSASSSSSSSSPPLGSTLGVRVDERAGGQFSGEYPQPLVVDPFPFYPPPPVIIPSLTHYKPYKQVMSLFMF